MEYNILISYLNIIHSHISYLFYKKWRSSSTFIFFFSIISYDGYLPPVMIETTIVPIVKNKSGNLLDSSNYRPIALANILSKMFESVLLFKCAEYISTSDNQFGFKSHGVMV